MRHLFVRFLSTMVACLLSVAASAQGQIVVFPNLDTKYGIGLPIGPHVENMLEGFVGTGVSVVTPRGGMTERVYLDTKAWRNLVDVDSAQARIAFAETLEAANISVSNTPNLKLLSEFFGTLPATEFDYADVLKVFGRRYIDSDSGTSIPTPLIDPDSHMLRWSVVTPVDAGSMLNVLNQPLPGLSVEENREYRELLGRFQQLEEHELQRFNDLFNKGISIPVNTQPRPPPIRNPKHIVFGSSTCPDGSELPIYCKFFKEEKWKPPDCICD